MGSFVIPRLAAVIRAVIHYVLPNLITFYLRKRCISILTKLLQEYTQNSVSKGWAQVDSVRCCPHPHSVQKTYSSRCWECCKQRFGKCLNWRELLRLLGQLVTGTNWCGAIKTCHLLLKLGTEAIEVSEVNRGVGWGHFEQQCSGENNRKTQLWMISQLIISCIILDHLYLLRLLVSYKNRNNIPNS